MFTVAQRVSTGEGVQKLFSYLIFILACNDSYCTLCPILDAHFKIYEQLFIAETVILGRWEYIVAEVNFRVCSGFIGHMFQPKLLTETVHQTLRPWRGAAFRIH